MNGYLFICEDEMSDIERPYLTYSISETQVLPGDNKEERKCF